MLKILILNLIIIIILYILNKYFFKKNINENYLTYFLPYYNSDTNKLGTFYKDNDNLKNYFKKKFNYNKINISATYDEKKIIEFIINSYIANSNIENIEIIIYKDLIKNVEDIEKNTFCVTDYPTLIYYIQNINNYSYNIKLIKSLYKIYIYPITKKPYKIYNLDEIKKNTTIGVIKNTSFYFFHTYYFNFLNYNLDTDINIIYYESDIEMFKSFIENKVQMIFITDTFPSKTILNFLDNNINEDIILLPFNIANEDVFFKRTKKIFIDYIDLNKLSNNYLPVNFDNYEYNMYKPDFKILYFDKFIIANKNTSDDDVYNFIEFIYYNSKYLNYNLRNSKYQIYNVRIDEEFLYITYHNGVLKFLKKYGYINEINNDNCKHLYGVMECTEENLKKNNLLL